MVTADSVFHFRIAATMLSPWEYRSGVYSKENLDDFAFRSKHVWWNRDAVDWIDPDSFPRLTPEKRVELRKQIATFLTGVETKSAASLAETLVARDALLGIFGIIGERIYDQKVQSAAMILTEEIRDPKYRGLFKAFDIKFDENWSGETIIVVWLVVEDSTPELPEFHDVYELFETELRLRLPQKGVPDYFVSLRLRTVSEQGEVLLGETE